MNGCTEWSDRLAALFDGELDALHAAEVEAHLAGCEACGAALEAAEDMRVALRAPSARVGAPAALTARLEASLAAASAPKEKALVLGARYRPAWRERAAWGGLGGGFALAACIAGALVILPGFQVRGLERELVASHVRSQLAGHLIDVATASQHVVKPWFGGKLDYSPPVTDLAAQGFPIVGGRLDYLAGREVAAIVYSRGAHVINLFVWPDAKGRGPGETHLDDGYTLLHWAKGGMTYWAVSDANPADLREFVRLLQAAE